MGAAALLLAVGGAGAASGAGRGGGALRRRDPDVWLTRAGGASEGDASERRLTSAASMGETPGGGGTD